MAKKGSSRFIVVILAALMALISAPAADACSRVTWLGPNGTVITGRSMDWPYSFHSHLYAVPAGSTQDGAGGVNSLTWTRKYGAIEVAGTTDPAGPIDGVFDGMNEKGLAAHMLYLNATDFGPRDTSKPGLHAGLWAQYLLDNAATVEEALKLFDQIQVVMVSANGHNANVHLAMEDATGDSAIIEYIGGKPVIHHGRQFTVMTNDPTYDQQLALLAKQDFSKPASDMPLPGNVNPVDRFQRATYYLHLLPKPADEREAAAGILAIARNVSVPFGAPYKGFGIYNTEYRTAANLTAKRYYFELTNTPNVIWADLDAMNLDAGQPVRALDPNSLDLSGNVMADFRVVPAPF